MKRQSSALKCLFFIVLWIALSHGLLILNDGIYWDAWIISLAPPGNHDALYSYCLVNGWIYIAWLNSLIGALPHVIWAYSLMSFAGVILLAFLTYAICRKSTFVTQEESCWIAIISAVHPVFQMFVAKNMLLSTELSLISFFFAVLLALQAETENRRRHWAYRAGALLLFLFSFHIKITLVFYFGFFLLLLLYIRRIDGVSWRSLWKHLVRRWDYLVLPFLDYYGRPYVLPKSGNSVLVEYPFESSLDAFFNNGANFYQNAIVDRLADAWIQVSSAPWIWLILLVVIIKLYSSLSRSFSGSLGVPDEKPKSQYGLMGFGVVLLALAIIPFAIVIGRCPALHGWTLRHTVLTPIPLAVILVGAMRAFSMGSAGSISRGGLIVLISLALGFSFSTNKDYIVWQARWVKDRSVMVNLARLENAEKYSVYWVDEQYLLGGESYRFYEYSSMFKQVWGDEKRIGFDAHLRSKPTLFEESKPDFTAEYNLRDFDPAGPQATLTICSAASPAISDFKLVMHYFYYRFLHPQRMQKFLEGVTQIKIQPIPSSVSP